MDGVEKLSTAGSRDKARLLSQNAGTSIRRAGYLTATPSPQSHFLGRFCGRFAYLRLTCGFVFVDQDATQRACLLVLEKTGTIHGRQTARKQQAAD